MILVLVSQESNKKLIGTRALDVVPLIGKEVGAKNDDFNPFGGNNARIVTLWISLWVREVSPRMLLYEVEKRMLISMRFLFPLK